MDNEITAIHETSEMTNQSEKSTLSGLGARLKKTRESMHLTQKEAAARLYLNPKIVEIIENEAFFDGPPMTFMRGYLRSYARLLNVPENDIKAAIEALELNTTPTGLAAPTLQASPIYRGDKYIRWITYLIVLTLISLVVIWWSSHSKYVITDVPSPNQVPAATSTTTTTETKPAETLSPVSTENAPSTITTTTAPTEPKAETIITEPTAATTTPTTNATPQTQTAPTAVVIPNNNLSPPTAPAAVSPTTSATPTSAIPSSDDTAVTTTATPLEENTANAVTTTTPKEKPIQHKKRHKRHQYRPIENMDIPEPD